MKRTWWLTLEIGDWSATVERDEDPDLSAPVVIGDGLAYSWSMVDDRAPGHIEPPTLTGVLHGFNAAVLPDVQIGDPVRLIFSSDLAAGRHIVFFRGRITDAEVESPIPGRQRRKADLPFAAADDLATFADVYPGPRSINELGNPPQAVDVGQAFNYAYNSTGHTVFWSSTLWGGGDSGNTGSPVTSSVESDNLLEYLRRCAAGQVRGGMPHTLASSSVLSGGRDISYPLTKPDSPGSWYTPQPKSDNVGRPAAYIVAHRVEAAGDEPPALELTLTAGVVGVRPRAPELLNYVARTVVPADVVAAPGRARRDRTSIDNVFVLEGSTVVDANDPTAVAITVRAADKTIYGDLKRMIATEAQKYDNPSFDYLNNTREQVAAAYVPDVEAVRAEWAYDEITVYPDLTTTLEQWNAAARLAQPCNYLGQLGREVVVTGFNPDDLPTGRPMVTSVQTRGTLTFSGGAPIVTFAGRPGPFKSPQGGFGQQLVTAAQLKASPALATASASNLDRSITAHTARYIAPPTI